MKTLLAAFFLCLFCGAAAAQGTLPVATFPAIATITASGFPAASYPHINVQGYYSGSSAGGGLFNWSAASTATADSCTIFSVSGVATGRWIREVKGSQLSLYDCGAKGDGSTDDSAAIQALENVAGTTGYIAFYPAATFKLTATITQKPGVIHQGAGIVYGGTAPTSHISASGFGGSAWCFSLDLPNGTTNIEAPKWYNIWIDGCTNSLRFNNPANGFTDDASSQQPMMRPYVIGMMFTGTGTTGIAVQASKTFQGIMRDSAVVGGGYDTLLDLEGSDHFLVAHNDFGGGQTQQVLLQAHSSFGNDDILNENNRFVSLANGGVAYITDNNRTSTIDNNFFEGSGTNACLISLSGGYDAHITNNDLSFGSGALTHWLCVTDASTGLTATGYTLIRAAGNQLNGVITGATAYFNAGAGIAYFNGSGAGRRLVIHNGNFQQFGDFGFPMNSIATSFDSIQYQPQTQELYSCNNDGLNFVSFGITVLCKYGAFQMASTGSGNTLQFGNSDRSSAIGALDMWVMASSASSANISGCVTDSGSCTSAYGTVALTTRPTWVKTISNATVATSGGANIYSSNADVEVIAVALVQH